MKRFLTAFGMTFAFGKEWVEEGGGFAAAFLYLLIIIRPVILSAAKNLFYGQILHFLSLRDKKTVPSVTPEALNFDNPVQAKRSAG